MAHWPAGKEASLGESGHRYERHRPEQTLLYQLVEEYYPAFVAQLAAQGTQLPGYVQREFEDYLKCGRLVAMTLDVISYTTCFIRYGITPGLHIVLRYTHQDESG